MADTLNDTPVDGDSWTELTDVAGITEGDEFDITNTSRPMTESRTIIIRIQDADPTASVATGIPITPQNHAAHTYKIQSGNNKVWARCVSSFVATVNLQPV